MMLQKILGVCLTIFILLLLPSITKAMGPEDPPFYYPVIGYRYISTFYSVWHPGIDFCGRCGLPVRASMGGVVTYSGWDNTGYGYRVDVVNSESDDRALYGHLSVITVKNGQHINKGEVIGSVGSTGHSTGCHLHFELWWKGRSVNPLISLRSI